MNDKQNHSPDKPKPTALPVVGLVASAGGLQAFKQFFKAMPMESGIAFILIPHLDPNHESLMAPLLAKQTKMPVIEASDKQRLEANHVYVIPPDRYLSLHDSVIQLSHPSKSSAGETAIDPFLRSLADDQQERAICIILSGSGGHGALGLKAVKAGGGMAMVQEPASAEYDQMPRSAIDTGLADYVLSPERMPGELMKYVQHFLFGIVVAPEPPTMQDDLAQVLALLRVRTKFDFRGYRERMLLRRIQRRMGLNHLDKIADYLTQLRERPDELNLLCKDLLISVTSFFRDPEMFNILETQVLPELIEARDAGTPVRVWVPGCATGEEAYSIAMLLIERIEAAGKSCLLQVFATDVDQSALEIARRGIYSQAMLVDVGQQRLARFFIKIDEDHWQAKKSLQEVMLFAPQNLLSDAPFSKLDLVSCRNLLIYLEPPIQQQLLELFHFALNEGGYLVLGPSESIGAHVNLYRPVSKKWRIFHRVTALCPVRVNFPIQASERSAGQRHALIPTTHQRDTLARQADKILLESHTPAAVIIDSRYEVLHYSGPTYNYLQQPGGAPSHDLLSMALPGLRPRIRVAVDKARQEQQRVNIGGNRIKRNERSVLVHITAQPLPGMRETEGLFLITFHDEPQALQKTNTANAQTANDESLVLQLEYELKTTREELQSTIEELESSNEELKASNEEAMSMNEEFQSTNEELETSKEELQSLNEELSTVNEQLQDNVAQLENSANDMANLIASIDAAIVFLGADRTIQRFTPSATHLFSLINSDLGRPISDIAMRFEDSELAQDIDRVLKNLVPSAKEVRGEDDHWYLRRITSYCTEGNHIEGVVLTFTDITPVKRAELAVREMANGLEQRVMERSRQLKQEYLFTDAVLDTVASLVLVIDAKQQVVRFNKACEQVTGYDFTELVGTTDWWKLVPVEQQAQVRGIVQRLLSGEEFVPHENYWVIRDGSKRLLSWKNTVLKNTAGKVQWIISSGLDITEQHKAETEARQHLEEASRLQRLQTANELATVLAHELNQPLAAIAMFADSGQQLLDHSPLQPDKLADLLTQVSEQALRAGEIIRRLRTFVGRSKIELAPMDLNAVMRHACALMALKTHNGGINILLDLDETLPKVMGDDLHLEQVLLNLLRNAIEAIHDAGMTKGTVTVSTRNVKGLAQTSVCDSGPGIDAKAAAVLFDPLLNSSKEHGLGVGLRISRSLIEAHNGRLWVEPHSPGGIFHFVLPFAP